MLKGIVSSNVTISVTFEQNADGTFFADCPEIPGCSATGTDRNDAECKIKEAVEACLDELLRAAICGPETRKTRTASRN
ncbi:MAG: type II toxin-antitoxin system HicB family antitoxin [Acidobacteriota bacterium]|nr:type II toxin-antitoxin system HicB family antitoxin [Acidobacteriota bacterium]